MRGHVFLAFAAHPQARASLSRGGDPAPRASAIAPATPNKSANCGSPGEARGLPRSPTGRSEAFLALEVPFGSHPACANSSLLLPESGVLAGTGETLAVTASMSFAKDEKTSMVWAASADGGSTILSSLRSAAVTSDCPSYLPWASPRRTALAIVESVLAWASKSSTVMLIMISSPVSGNIDLAIGGVRRTAIAHSSRPAANGPKRLTCLQWFGF